MIAFIGERISKDIMSDANNDKTNIEIENVLNQKFSSDSDITLNPIFRMKMYCLEEIQA